MSTLERFMIIDGNALVHRAFHALPPLSKKDGKLVNAVYGFTTVLMKALKELNPAYAAVTFDLPGGTFRNELYKEYKAQRIKKPQELYDQFPLVKEVVRAFGISVVEKQGFEADDLIATLSRKSEIRNLPAGKAGPKSEIETIIVTGDMDTLQLVDEHTKVYSFRKGFSDVVIYDEKAVHEKYGLRPDQMIDYKALRGDPSDNIPGVRGIGEKTASELISKFESLEKVYEVLEQGSKNKEQTIRPKVAELLKTYKADAMLGKTLVTLVRDVQIDATLLSCKVYPQDSAKLREVFEKFGFKNLVARLEKENPAADLQPAQKNQGSLLEGNGLVPTQGSGRQRELSSVVPIVILKQGTIGHDLKTILHSTSYVLHPPIFDTMIASYLLNPGSRTHDFIAVVRDHNIAMEEISIVLSKLKHLLQEKLNKENLTDVFEKIEMPLIPVLSKMEETGIKINASYLKTLSEDFEKELSRLTKEIYKHAEQEFNINSPLQLREILFEKMKLAPEVGRIKKTAKGGVSSTAAGQLEKLRGTHPIVDLIFDYRELAKLQGTYATALPELIDKKDARVHSTFNQAVTATGRLSSSNPNLQNIPIKTENGRMIRNAFIAEKGFVLFSADYSQIELRVAASLSGDSEMIKAFQSGHDFHTETAARVFEVIAEKVDAQMRRKAKAINFGIIYGMGATSLAIATGTTRAEAEQFIERYFEVFNTLRDYLEGLKEQARTAGYVETLFGRRRYLPEITSGVQQIRASAERMAINMPVQGTAADLMKMAMIKIHESIKTLKHESSVRMLLQVHDELVFEIKKELVSEVAPKIKSIMESVYALKVPIVVDLKQGENWGEMDKFPLLS
ncbi:MAG: DNA polymerase I [bacterium]|nr:DNA polymerase I [bacterium]